MLREFQLKNFKAFADTGLLPLRPDYADLWAKLSGKKALSFSR